LGGADEGLAAVVETEEEELVVDGVTEVVHGVGEGGGGTGGEGDGFVGVFVIGVVVGEAGGEIFAREGGDVGGGVGTGAVEYGDGVGLAGPSGGEGGEHVVGDVDHGLVEGAGIADEDDGQVLRGAGVGEGVGIAAVVGGVLWGFAVDAVGAEEVAGGGGFGGVDDGAVGVCEEGVNEREAPTGVLGLNAGAGGRGGECGLPVGGGGACGPGDVAEGIGEAGDHAPAVALLEEEIGIFDLGDAAGIEVIGHEVGEGGVVHDAVGGGLIADEVGVVGVSAGSTWGVEEVAGIGDAGGEGGRRGGNRGDNCHTQRPNGYGIPAHGKRPCR